MKVPSRIGKCPHSSAGFQPARECGKLVESTLVRRHTLKPLNLAPCPARPRGRASLMNPGRRMKGSWGASLMNPGRRMKGSWGASLMNPGRRMKGSWGASLMNPGRRMKGSWGASLMNPGRRMKGSWGASLMNSGRRMKGRWRGPLMNSGRRMKGRWRGPLMNPGRRMKGRWGGPLMNSARRMKADGAIAQSLPLAPAMDQTSLFRLLSVIRKQAPAAAGPRRAGTQPRSNRVLRYGWSATTNP
jgi:hypothetical protein